MNLLRRWARQPQQIWLRRALFQIHMWLGIGAGLYILLISATGSAVVFRDEMSRWLQPTKYVVVGPRRLTDEELRASAQKAMPKLTVRQILPASKPNVAVEVWMTRGRLRVQRLFDPYTGADLGDVVPMENARVRWLVELHDNLLGGHTGRTINGVGALLLLGLCLSGIVIWWPGTANWWRGLVVRRHVGWKRFNWDLHSMMGFWTMLLLLMWAVSAAYLVWPDPFGAVVDYFEPFPEGSFEPRMGDDALAWLARIHFGRFAGVGTKSLYVVLGLAPAALFVTGVVMWWNRVVRTSSWYRESDSLDTSQRRVRASR